MMSEKPYYEEPNQTVMLRVWALGQMVWGAFLAGAGLLAIIAVLAVIYGIGLLLPEESRQTPSPYGAIQVEVTETVV
jgi:Intrinsic membrane protein PufX